MDQPQISNPEKYNWLGNLLKVNFAILAIQNGLLGIGFLLDQFQERSGFNTDDNGIITQALGELGIAFYLDVIGFFILFILAIIHFYLGKDRINWGLITSGSFIFVYVTIVWRAALNFFPEQYLDVITLGQLTASSPEISGWEALTFVYYALRASNFGLLLVSIGLFREDTSEFRYLILIYGIANIALSFTGIFIIFKFLTVYFAIGYFAYHTFVDLDADTNAIFDDDIDEIEE